MLRMLMWASYGIRFERKAGRQVEYTRYRWFCRLDLDDQVL